MALHQRDFELLRLEAAALELGGDDEGSRRVQARAAALEEEARSGGHRPSRWRSWRQ